MVTVLRNTYPTYQKVPHAEIGDIAEWRYDKGHYNLIRLSDNATLFATSKCNVTTGLLYSSQKPPKLFGVIASVKSKGWYLEVSQNSL